MYLLCKKIDGIIQLRGIFDDKQEARSQAISGQWLVIPVNANDLYFQDIVSEQMEGASWQFGQTDDLNIAIQTLNQRIDNLITQLLEFRDTTNDHLATIDSRLDALENP